MKKLLLITFLALASCVTFAQTKEQTEQASVKALADHDYLTLFIGKNFNQVSPNMDMYLQTELGYKSVGSPKVTDLKNGTYSYKTTWLGSTDEKETKPLTLTYILDDAKTIKKVAINGDWVDLAELFLYYWPTKVTAQEIKEKRVAQCNLLSDKIVYHAAQTNGAEIMITNQ